VLVDSAALEGIGGFAALRGALIDDCTLARRIKDAGGRTWIGLTHRAVSHRRMGSLRAVWRMVARSAFAQLRHSALLLAVCISLLAVAFWIPVVALLIGNSPQRAIGASALVTMAITYVPTLRYYGRSWLWSLTLPLIGTLYAAMTISSAVDHWRGRGAVWKGRTYGRGAVTS
jgi:hypothetical protein